MQLELIKSSLDSMLTRNIHYHYKTHNNASHNHIAVPTIADLYSDV